MNLIHPGHPTHDDKVIKRNNKKLFCHLGHDGVEHRLHLVSVHPPIWAVRHEALKVEELTFERLA